MPTIQQKPDLITSKMTQNSQQNQDSSPDRPSSVTTSLATSFRVRMIGMTLACVVFGVWGLYDYFIKIPQNQAIYDKYSQLSELETKAQKSPAEGGGLTAAQVIQLNELKRDPQVIEATKGGSVPKKPGAFDRWTQLAFISLLPCAPFIWLMYSKQKKMVYRIDEAGTVHLPAEKRSSAENWTAEQIKDIDMSRWMAKSIAVLEHQDGRQVKLDAYLHKNLHLVIGRVANRLYPDQWEADGRKIKRAAEEEATEDNPAQSETTSQG